jgi:hypothetical protein
MGYVEDKFTTRYIITPVKINDGATFGESLQCETSTNM